MTKDIGEKFGIDKCGVLAMKWGKKLNAMEQNWKMGKKWVRSEKKGISTLVFWRKAIYVKNI